MADQGHQVADLTPEDVSRGMAEGRYLLVDVREPNEVAVEAYPDAAVVPLSTFDPRGIPDPRGKQGQDYTLWSILSLVIIGLLCGRQLGRHDCDHGNLPQAGRSVSPIAADQSLLEPSANRVAGFGRTRPHGKAGGSGEVAL